MTITTSREKTFDVDWAWGPVGERGQLMIQYADERLLSEIAKDFEGLESISRKDENEGNAMYTGYSRLVSIVRHGEKVQLALEREANG